MDLELIVNNATLLTANGVGTLDIIGNTTVTQSVSVRGDSKVDRNSLVNGELHVIGSSLLNGDVTITDQLTVPTVNVTHLYQPSNWAVPSSTGITIQGSSDSGTYFYINYGTTITLPSTDIPEGINYQVLISSITSTANNTLAFTAPSGTIYYRIIGSGTTTGSLNDIYLYTDTDLGTVGPIAYVFNTSWSIPTLTATTMRRSTAGTINFNLLNMSIGDRFDLVYIGGNRWVINGSINNISSMY
jgi:hypothetical protein